jgi:hypothetical protein
MYMKILRLVKIFSVVNFFTEKRYELILEEEMA